MALYQDLIMDQIKNIGKPRESKSTTTQIAEPPKEGMDIGGLMMMLMMMQMFKNPQQQPGGGDLALNPQLGSLFNNPYASNTQGAPSSPFQAPQFSLSQPMGAGGGNDMLSQILMALMGQGMQQA